MASNHNPYSSRRGSLVSGQKLPQATKASYGHSPKQYSHRNRLRGANHMKYTGGVLTQDRVAQKFGFYYDHDPDYYGDEVALKEESVYQLSDYDLVPDEYQYELPLKNVDEVEGELNLMIRKYQYAMERMGVAALLWDDLMEDLEDNPHLAEEFNKFQMLRKLSGGQL